MGAIKFITGLLLIGLFAIAVVTFSINFANDNNSAVNLINDSDLVSIRDNIITEVDELHTAANSSATSFIKTSATTGDQVSESGSQFKVGWSNTISMTTSAIRGGYKKIFGSDTGFGIFLTAFLSLTGFVAFWYGYKAWWGRNPD